mmetsp:Transcript_37299/g.99373  ORF Transcript_37299/g.99373 Transcript_37299/m.99373 type:complete len:206 (-) Transcript_37299:609-1226(-)
MQLGEFDLLDIGEDVLIDKTALRGFCFDEGAMALRRVTLGRRCVICAKVAIAPGAAVPPGACLGPLSSSYQLSPENTPEPNRAFCAAAFPEPCWPLRAFGYLIMVLVWFTSQIPALMLLRQILLEPWYTEHLQGVREVIKWFLNPDRVGFYVAIRITRATAAPLIRLACCIVVKHVVVGRFTEGRRDRSQYNIFRHWLVAELMPV